ncbi:Hypothetical predicted protein [Cloeon dipterum]|uniref:Cytochrome P450 n=1 Tax=Cloeon dipterum TaxID=197152 RepID=A0A8S1C7N6_9INSE|nr:Hypothetical predicted protein [Cloeon dipterum]
MDALLVTLALAGVLLAVLYHLSVRNFGYWKKRGVPFIKPLPLVGSQLSVLALREHIGDFLDRYARKYKGQRFVGFFQGNTPALIVMDPELVKAIIVKDFSHFVDHAFEVSEESDPMQSKNLFNMKGQKWREMRNKLSPTFTSGKMKGMYPLVEDCAKNVESFIRQHQNENVDIKDLLARFTTDVIGSCAFGVSIDSVYEPHNQFRAMGKRMLEVDFIQAIKNACIVFLPELAKLFKFKFFPEEVNDFFRNLVKQIVSQRTKSGNMRKDFMQLLIQLKQLGKLKQDDEVEKSEHEGWAAVQTDYKLTDDDIVAQALVFFFAGFETSSSNMTFAMLELARHPDVQQKARDNIEEVLQRHNGQMSYQALQEMTFLDWIMLESLRMYPPVTVINRMCTKKYKIPDSDLTLEKGDLVMIPNRALQNDPDYFDNPEVFNPERFSDEEKNHKNQFIFLPFGEGPRQCIGMRFAKMQSKLGLYTILRNFEIASCPKTVYPPQWDPKQFLLVAKDDIFVQLKAL